MRPRLALAPFAALALLGLVACSGHAAGHAASRPGASPSRNAPAPNTAAFPPKTYADFQHLYGLYAGAQLQGVSDEQVGIQNCNQHRVSVIIPKSDTAEEIAGALAKAFVDARMSDGIVLAYYSRAEVNDAYTAGRLERDTPCTGASNSLELDIGSAVGTNQTYVITKGLPPGQ